MNNWRLLLFAVVAVFQPIASFTERSLVDGRHQCCDHYSPAPFGDTRPSLHGTYRLEKPSSELRRLIDREEIQENRRFELRERDSSPNRFSTERVLVDRDREIRERDTRQGFSILSRSARVEPRFERITVDQRRERHERERVATNVRDLKSEDHTRQVRFFRNVDDRRNKFTRDESRSNRLGNENLARTFDTRRDLQRTQSRSEEHSLNRRVREVNNQARNEITRAEVNRQVRNEMTRSETPLDNRRHIVRERLSVVRREPSVRADLRRVIRDDERQMEERRLVLINTRLVELDRDMRSRLNSREDIREMRQRVYATRDQSSERSNERREINERRELRERYNDNINRRVSYERINRVARETLIATRNEVRENSGNRLSSERNQMDRRNARESRQLDSQRNLDSQREIRHDERRSTEIRANIDRRVVRDRIQTNRGDVHELIVRPEAREVDGQRNTRHNFRLSTAERLTRDQFPVQQRLVVARRNTRVFGNVNNLNIRNEREAEIRQERRDTRISKENRDNTRETIERRISREETHRNTRDHRIVNTESGNMDRSRDIRYNERLIRVNRNDIREDFDRRPSRENRQSERREAREFEILNRLSRSERDSESRRELRSNDRLTRQNRALKETERQMETRSSSRTYQERDVDMDVRRFRSVDRRNIREIRAQPKLSRSRSADTSSKNRRVEYRQITENRERDTIDFRSRNIELDRREVRSPIIRKTETENESGVPNWQYVLYTLQGAYLCALFMHMFGPSRTGKQRSSLHWLPMSYNPIKLD